MHTFAHICAIIFNAQVSPYQIETWCRLGAALLVNRCPRIPGTEPDVPCHVLRT